MNAKKQFLRGKIRFLNCSGISLFCIQISLSFFEIYYIFISPLSHQKSNVPRPIPLHDVFQPPTLKGKDRYISEPQTLTERPDPKSRGLLECQHFNSWGKKIYHPENPLILWLLFPFVIHNLELWRNRTQKINQILGKKILWRFCLKVPPSELPVHAPRGLHFYLDDSQGKSFLIQFIEDPEAQSKITLKWFFHKLDAECKPFEIEQFISL